MNWKTAFDILMICLALPILAAIIGIVARFLG
jgi:hypothetical protein